MTVFSSIVSSDLTLYQENDVFPFLVTAIISGNNSSLNDTNVSEYCSRENHLSLFHPQAKVSSLLERI